MDAIFTVQNVNYAYSTTSELALNDISMTITQGSRVAIMGANGSGKSTLLRILDGLYFPQSGSVTAFDHPLDEAHLMDEAYAHAFRRRVAFVFQNPDVQLFNPTVYDEVAFAAFANYAGTSPPSSKKSPKPSICSKSVIYVIGRPTACRVVKKNEWQLPQCSSSTPKSFCSTSPQPPLIPKAKAASSISWSIRAPAKKLLWSLPTTSILFPISPMMPIFSNKAKSSPTIPPQFVGQSPITPRC
jgi:ABC-type sugar transport system ATPase subunit